MEQPEEVYELSVSNDGGIKIVVDYDDESVPRMLAAFYHCDLKGVEFQDSLKSMREGDKLIVTVKRENSQRQATEIKRYEGMIVLGKGFKPCYEPKDSCQDCEFKDSCSKRFKPVRDTPLQPVIEPSIPLVPWFTYPYTVTC
jgi:hypothetical protein